jgi:hypothetical protein
MNERMLQPAQLEKYALADNWGPIDKDFASRNQGQFSGLLAFARKKLATPNGNLQDLGATIFQNYAGTLTSSDSRLLVEVTKSPGNQFARYRAGFALWKHGDHSDYVRQIVEEAKACEDVADIAIMLLKAS